MSTFLANNLKALEKFKDQEAQLGILQRNIPQNTGSFFQDLMSTSFEVAGKVSAESALKDIECIIKDHIPGEIVRHSFFEHWLDDMAQICITFCKIQDSNAICFWLGTQRGCRRYHIDNVPLRMLVTYAGQGTEWLPDEAADRDAFRNGEPNEKIVKDKSALQFLNQWDIAVFRGGSQGLLHRTPDAALSHPSILMRLDHVSFWENCTFPALFVDLKTKQQS